MPNLSNLPDLALREIFRFLSAKELKVVRLVSKRLAEAVLTNDARMKTWRIKIPSDLQENTDKVSQYDINIEVHLHNFDKDNQKEIVKWFKKHSVYITALLDCTDSNLEKLLPYLKQVRSLKLDFLSEDTDIMSQIGPQLERLTLKDIEYDIDYQKINLSSLKHLKLSDCEDEYFKIVPPNLESLRIEYPHEGEAAEDDTVMELPCPGSMLKRLKTLDITFPAPLVILPVLHSHYLSASLTRLCLAYIDLQHIELDVDPQACSALKEIELVLSSIKVSTLNYLLRRCSRTLTSILIEEGFGVYPDKDLEVALPSLTSLTVTHEAEFVNICWLLQLLPSAKSLTTLNLHGVEVSGLEHLSCDLPNLKYLSMSRSSNQFINNVLRICSASLQKLRLLNVEVNFDVRIPNLKVLSLISCKVKGIKRLLDPRESKLEAIVLYYAEVSIWNDMLDCTFPSLKVLLLSGLDSYFEKREIVEKFKKTLRPDVNIFTRGDKCGHIFEI